MPVRVTPKRRSQNQVPRSHCIRPTKSHLARWIDEQKSRKVPFLILKVAVQLANQAGELSALFEMVESERFRSASPEIDSATWERFYRRPKQLHEQLGNLLNDGAEAASIIPSGTTARSTVIASRLFLRADPAQRKSLIQEAIADPGFRASLHSGILAARMAEEQFQANPYDTSDVGEFSDADIASAPVQFHLRVWMPCWLLYGKGTDSLYEEAAAGNLSAAEKLIRIDKRAILLPKLARWIPRWMTSGNKGAVSAFAEAMGTTSTPKQKVSAVKIGVIAMIFGLSRKLCSGKTLPIASLQVLHLRGLFDAIARDSGKVIDEDLPGSNQTLRKDVQRAGKNQDLTAWDIF